MKKSSTPSILGLVAALVLLAGFASPATAAGEWHLRGVGAWVEPDVDWTQTSAGETVRVTSDGAFGFGFDAEYQISPRWGIDFGALTAAPDINVELDSTVPVFSVGTSDNPAFRPLTAGVNVHLTPKAKVDFYVGAFFAYVLYDDLNLRLRAEIPVDGSVMVVEDQVHINIDNDFTWGGLIGLDVPLGQGNWGFAGTLRYIDTDVDTTDEDGDRTTIGYDPLIVTFGFVYSF